MTTNNEKRGKPKARGNGQGTIYKRANGTFQTQVTVGMKDGKPHRVTVTAKTKSEAEKKRNALLTDLERGLLSAPNRVTVEEYAGRWLERQRDLRKRSARLYGVELGYALETIGTMKLRDVKAHHLKDLMTALAEREMKGSRGKSTRGPMAPRTQSKVLTRLRALFREAVTDQIIYVNPADAVRRVKMRPMEVAGVSLDFDQAARFRELGEALYGAGVCRVWPALFTLVSVGLRRGEAMGLAWDNVDFENKELRIRQSRTVNDGEVTQTGTKTDTSNRDIPMPPSLIESLKEIKARQALEREAAGSAWQDTGAVLATEVGNWTHPSACNTALNTVLRWSDPKAFAALAASVRRMVPARTLAQLEVVVMAGEKLPEISPHDLRHTYATLALRSRKDIAVVSKTLGHAKISITMDIYRHVIESERKDAVLDLFSAPLPTRKMQEVAEA